MISIGCQIALQEKSEPQNSEFASLFLFLINSLTPDTSEINQFQEKKIVAMNGSEKVTVVQQ